MQCFSAKYDLILDEQGEDSKSSHSHTSKKHKKKTRHCSEEKEDEEYMPIKNPNQVLLIFRLKYGESSSL
jgi:peptidyl-prolyl cis-trans isomerase-like 4